MKILIVDDSLDIQTFLTFLLQMKGHVCKVCSNGYSATLEIRSADLSVPYDLYFFDNDMAERGEGLRFIETLRDMGNRTPVIFMTGEISSAKDDMAKSLGVFSILHKPFKPSEIETILDKFQNSNPTC